MNISKSKDSSSSDSSSDSSSSEDSSVSRKHKKKDKKKSKHSKKSKKQQKPKKKVQEPIDTFRIIHQENLSQKLRLECFAILLHLASIHDQEIYDIFERHIRSQNPNSKSDSSSMIAELSAKTEDFY